MYNRYICPIQPLQTLTLKLLIEGHPRSAKVTHIANFKSAYVSLIIGPRSAKVTHIANFKSAYISLIIGPRGLQCETNR